MMLLSPLALRQYSTWSTWVAEETSQPIPSEARPGVCAGGTRTFLAAFTFRSVVLVRLILGATPPEEGAVAPTCPRMSTDRNVLLRTISNEKPAFTLALGLLRNLLDDELVDLTGIEPVTSSMPWKRAPSCATGPLSGRTSTILGPAARLVKRAAQQPARGATIADSTQ